MKDFFYILAVGLFSLAVGLTYADSEIMIEHPGSAATQDAGSGMVGTSEAQTATVITSCESCHDNVVKPPHSIVNDINCVNCHGMRTFDEKLRGDELGTMCKSCHNPLGAASGMSAVANHVVNSGTTVIDCTYCHFPHKPMPSADTHPGGTTGDNLNLIRSHLNVYVPQAVSPTVFQVKPDHYAFADANPPYNGVCQSCHTQTAYHTNDASGDHEHNTGISCVSCHPHSAGFLPSGGACDSCHGQPPNGSSFPNFAGSHATHMSDIKGPGITDCFICHAALDGGTHMNDSPSFASGVDENNNGNIDLSETDVCNHCHSPDGAYDGVNDPDFGAIANWNTGVYNQNSLASNEQQWCVGCHDMGSSTIQGVNAPPVGGDGNGWGYFATGHGKSSVVSCSDCHDPNSLHIDGQHRTYQAELNNYQAGYRLASVNGQAPLRVPITGIPPQNGRQQPDDYRLCFSCHDQYQLLGDIGRSGTNGDWLLSSWGTNFREEENITPLTDVINGHYAHVGRPGPGGPLPGAWDSDWNGTADSRPSCTTCHNVHGSPSSAMIRHGKLISTPPEMTDKIPALDFRWYQEDGSTQTNILSESRWGHTPPMDNPGPTHLAESNVCDSCHGGPNSTRYYREPVQNLTGCIMCHSHPMDNSDGIPVSGRRAVVGEFPQGSAHAHYGAELDDGDCLVCHSMDTHQDGYVDLIDPDNGNLYRFVQPEDLVTDPDVSNFCMGCHDDDGATRLGTPYDPFGNGNPAGNIASRFMGTLQWNEWYGDFCFGEEGTLRAVNSHHDISDGDQAFSGAKLECLNCHGAHNVSAAQPLADPFDTTANWTGDENGFCLSCHNGGVGPVDPGFPAGVIGPAIALRGLDTCDYIDTPWYVDYTWTNAAHGKDSKRGWADYSGAPGYELQCLDCHDSHGSYTAENPLGNPYMIRDFVDGTGYIDDGVRPLAQWNGPPWETYGVARSVKVTINGTQVDWGSELSLCSVCHVNWIASYDWHSYCDGCQSCHGHGQAWGNYDWGAGNDDDQPCPIPAAATEATSHAVQVPSSPEGNPNPMPPIHLIRSLD